MEADKSEGGLLGAGGKIRQVIHISFGFKDSLARANDLKFCFHYDLLGFLRQLRHSR